MAFFSDQPQEIVDTILQWLTPKDLCTLCLVNKAFCTVAQPRLYAKVEWEWGAKVPPVDILLRTLLEKPALGGCVQSVILKGADIGYYYRPATQAKPRFDDGGVDDLVAFVKSRGLPRRYSNNWIKGLRCSQSTFKMDAYIACFLAMLPNLWHLKFEPEFAYRSRLSSRMFRAALSVFPRPNRPRLPHFEQLRDVAFLRRIGSIPGIRPQGAHILTPFFYLPAVHRVSACIDNMPYWKWPEHRPALETLTTLNVGFVHPKHIGTILSETRNLQTLWWDWRGGPYGTCKWINLNEIMAALQHVQKTLIELRISGSCDYSGHDRYSLNLTGSLQGMEAFETLKTLEIPLAFVAGLVASVPPTRIGETLPATVEHVALSDDFIKDGDWRGQKELEVFTLWMEEVKTVTPRLRRFEWVAMLRETVWEWHDNPGLEASLLAACGRAGVEVEVVKRPTNSNRRRLAWE